MLVKQWIAPQQYNLQLSSFMNKKARENVYEGD
jgi:hypothetical protein